MAKLTLSEQLAEINQREQDKVLEATSMEQEYIPKTFEILEGEIREVIENEGNLVRENPLDFPASVQRKYFGEAEKDWKYPPSVEMEVDSETEQFIIPEGKQVLSYEVINPYTKEYKTIYELRDIYISPPPSNQEIGDKITQDVFGGNPYAQLADMVKAQVITLALLVPVLGKETVKVAYADLLATVQKVSESRVSQGLSPYDLSFLD